MFALSYQDLSGVAASWTFGFPRTISASHKAWQYIEGHKSDDFQRLLRDRSIKGNDMADDDGTPLLVVCREFFPIIPRAR